MKLNCPKFQGGSHLCRQGETIPTCNMAQSSITGSFPYLLLESQLDKLTLVLKLDFKYSHPSPKQREIYAKSLFLDTQILGWWIYTYLYQEVFSIKEKKGTLRFYNLFSKEKKKGSLLKITGEITTASAQKANISIGRKTENLILKKLHNSEVKADKFLR